MPVSVQYPLGLTLLLFQVSTLRGIVRFLNLFIFLSSRTFPTTAHMPAFHRHSMSSALVQ